MPSPTLSRARKWCVFCVAGAALLLAACDNSHDGKTAGQKLDSAIQKTEDATAAAARKAAELAETARDKTKAYLESPEAKQDAAAAKEAVKSAGTALESTVEDAAITASVSTALARDPDLSAVRIDVDTHKGAVKLSGPAPTAEAKARAETLAKTVKGVVSVDNQLVVTAAK